MSQLKLSPTPLRAFAPSAIQTRSSLLSSSSRDVHVPPRTLSMAATPIMSNQTVVRRSADYKPSIWGHDYIQSLKTEYDMQGESLTRHINKLKEDVRVVIKEYAEKDILHQLELIDTLQRLGLSYHFEDEIKMILEKVYSDHNNCDYGVKKNSLYAKALEFKLLRQHGYYVPQDVFNDFRDESGEFKADDIGEECDKAMLYMYGASFLSMEGETILDAAKSFTRNHLNEYCKRDENKDQYLFTLVEHALEFPLHWRMQRMEARWFIEVYQQNPDMNPILLDLAKLDFNMVQSVYQEDLRDTFMWWERTSLGESLDFIRDRLLENFLWTIGDAFQPQYGYRRRMATKVNALITTIDDIYDVYGTLDELELFTDAVDRWVINAVEHLPDYMKPCFITLHNFGSQVASDVYKEQGLNVLTYIHKAWRNLCKSYLVEAKWFHSGYTPTLQEYIENAVVSISAPVILFHAYVLGSEPITMEDLRYLDEEFPNIIRCASMVLRLTNDIGTSQDEMKRGDISKSIQCYMHETGASEQDAREYVRGLVGITWKKMNKELIEVETSPLPPTLIEAAMNLARTAIFMYWHGDGHSSQDPVMRRRVYSLLESPIP